MDRERMDRDRMDRDRIDRDRMDRDRMDRDRIDRMRDDRPGRPRDTRPSGPPSRSRPRSPSPPIIKGLLRDRDKARERDRERENRYVWYVVLFVGVSVTVAPRSLIPHPLDYLRSGCYFLPVTDSFSLTMFGLQQVATVLFCTHSA